MQTPEQGPDQMPVQTGEATTNYAELDTEATQVLPSPGETVLLPGAFGVDQAAEKAAIDARLEVARQELAATGTLEVVPVPGNFASEAPAPIPQPTVIEGAPGYVAPDPLSNRSERPLITADNIPAGYAQVEHGPEVPPQPLIDVVPGPLPEVAAPETTNSQPMIENVPGYVTPGPLNDQPERPPINEVPFATMDGVSAPTPVYDQPKTAPAPIAEATPVIRPVVEQPAAPVKPRTLRERITGLLGRKRPVEPVPGSRE